MAKKYQYINSRLIKATATLLAAYKEEHPSDETPLKTYCEAHKIGKQDRSRFVRAAQQLDWDVIRTGGKVYENGRLLWNE